MRRSPRAVKGSKGFPMLSPWCPFAQKTKPMLRKSIRGGPSRLACSVAKAGSGSQRSQHSRCSWRFRDSPDAPEICARFPDSLQVFLLSGYLLWGGWGASKKEAKGNPQFSRACFQKDTPTPPSSSESCVLRKASCRSALLSFGRDGSMTSGDI